MEVDIDEYKNNISKIQKYVGDDVTLIPLIKGPINGLEVALAPVFLSTFE